MVYTVTLKIRFLLFLVNKKNALVQDREDSFADIFKPRFIRI